MYIPSAEDNSTYSCLIIVKPFIHKELPNDLEANSKTLYNLWFLSYAALHTKLIQLK